jgi:long-subunit fatty acid transport protein
MSYSINARSRVNSLVLQLHRWYVRFLIKGSLFLATSVLLFAGPSSTVTDSKDTKGLSLDHPPTLLKEDVSLDYSYVGGADLHSGLGGHLGEQTTQFRYGLKAPLNDQWSLHFGLDYNRIDFGQPTGSPLPYNLQTLSFGFGANYKISDQWSVFGDVSPRLNMIDGWNQIESQDFQVGGMVGANYEFNKDLSLRFGLGINPGETGIPVMPILGVRWRFTDLWTLNFGFPRTSVDYQILPNLRLSPIEVGFEGGSFHTNKTYGSLVGMPQLNDRELDYREVRVGVGADYAITKNIHAGLTAGAVVYREFNFNDANFSPKVDPAPYVQLGVRIGF